MESQNREDSEKWTAVVNWASMLNSAVDTILYPEGSPTHDKDTVVVGKAVKIIAYLHSHPIPVFAQIPDP